MNRLTTVTYKFNQLLNCPCITFNSVQVITRKSSKFNGQIPVSKLTITYSRSGGPGGQNVNMVNTKVDLRFHVATADWLHDELKCKLLDKCKNAVSKDGYFIIKSEKTRSQHSNLADAVNKLTLIIQDLDKPEAVVSKETEEVWKRRLEKNNTTRVSEKRKRSEIKQNRQTEDFFWD